MVASLWLTTMIIHVLCQQIDRRLWSYFLVTVTARWRQASSGVYTGPETIFFARKLKPKKQPCILEGSENVSHCFNRNARHQD
jgi:hypothetical protein